MPMPRASVIIPTYNRAELLGKTLDRLGSLSPALDSWEVVVVDNNSTDGTRVTVEQRAHAFPVPLRYLFEPAQGRSHALNTGIASSRAPVIVFTDDDVLVGERWLDEATAPLLGDGAIEYTGGPVQPIWESPRPEWLSAERGDLWGTIAILDYGDEPFFFEQRQRVPLGANMAVHRRLVERIGPFNTALGRSGQHLLGQEVPEFLSRARHAGSKGLYAPGMLVHHHVPTRRLTKEYFRRWWFGKGISRSQLDDLQPITELGLDLRRVKRLAGLPLFMIRAAALDVFGWMAAAFLCDQQERARREMMLCYFAGYVAGRCRRETTGRRRVGKLLPS
jgi:glycosyltransferase involved in cell wall biosynthesis